MAQLSTVISTSWLHAKYLPLAMDTILCCFRLGDQRTKVLDASWYMPQMKRNPVKEYKTEHIPRAQYFDINGICDKLRHDSLSLAIGSVVLSRMTTLPHMLPSEKEFAAAVDSLGISSEDHVVVYDGMGLFSAARAWWTFRIFGHEKVSVLDGGLPAWKAQGFEVQSGLKLTKKEILVATNAALNAKQGMTKYLAKLDKSQVRSVEEMLELVKDRSMQILDARPEGRFYGKDPEPRKGLRSGHIPGSLSVPHKTVLTAEGFLKSKEELLQVLKDAQVDMTRDTVCSCGSGITACVLALILDQISFENKVAVYDGSWSEWGGREDTPVTT